MAGRLYTRPDPPYACLRVFGLSASEIGLVLFILFIIVAAGKLPRVGEGIGAFVAGYRKGTRQDDEGIEVKTVDRGDS